ncbi:solute carrier family 25 member 45 [Anopheles ziemanni]|uniref:solute carrier family 25 member 45 n=1 Tax=Anopheles coustani TaxID=139045 RepID=UPI0026597FA8|nr:solute carrier family 25 member 45 [Anopheles coustani]XP_058174814.1 solute carrier family 25 member 45 [Anopheles ziemanni]
MEENSNTLSPILCDFIAGSFGGACGLLVGHPMDTIKAWQQNSNYGMGNAMYNIIIRNNGLKGFYRGMYFPLLSNGALNSVVFAVYGSHLRYLQKHTRSDRLRKAYWRKHVFIAGSMAGLAQVFLACPIEVVKVRLQTLSFIGHPWACLKDIFRREGLSGIYRGITPMMVRDVLPYGVYMYVYEYMLEIERRLHRLSKDHITGATIGGALQASLIATAGAVAGIASWMFIVPFDVVKTVMQAETDPSVHKSMMHCFRSLVKKYGWRSLFRGSLVIIARAAPVNSATFLGYEYCLEKCHKVLDTN